MATETLAQLDYRIARLQGYGEALRAALVRVEWQRKHAGTAEAAVAALEAVAGSIASAEDFTMDEYRTAVRERDARIYPDRGGDPDGDSLVGRDY